MPATILTGPPLGHIRSLLTDADDATLAVSYLRPAGIGLLRPQLATVATGRLLVATDRVTTADGITAARAARFDVRSHSPTRGSHHAKVWLVRHGDTRSALIGSGNCTGGMSVNDEAHVLLTGPDSQPQLDDLDRLLRTWWDEGACDPEKAIPPDRTVDVVPMGLWAHLAAELGRDPVVHTATGRSNRVVAHDRTGFIVATAASDQKGTGGQRVPAWMVEVVWEHLLRHGTVTSAQAQAGHGDGGLNVKRSAFVLGLLARHTDVEWASRTRGSAAIRLKDGQRIPDPMP